VISELNSQACTPPVNASPPPYEKPTHDSRPRLVANHYHAGDFHPLLFAGFYRRFRLDPFTLELTTSWFSSILLIAISFTIFYNLLG